MKGDIERDPNAKNEYGVLKMTTGEKTVYFE